MPDAELATREEILPLLNPFAPKPGGGFVTFHCPVPGHGQGKGDHNRSASLSSKGVVQCHAGCTFKDIMAALREASGVRPGQRASTNGSHPQPHESGNRLWPDPKRMVEAYEYRDAYGNLVGVKGRFEFPNPEAKKGRDKFFSWRHPEHDWKDGLNKYGLGMSSMPLWGAELLDDVPFDQRIWIAEGESATKAVRATGEVAVCPGGGAGQVDFGQSLEVLRGRAVILWPDNDEPGRKFMTNLRGALRGVAKTVTMVSAPVPPGGDAVEYFQAGGSVEKLLAGVVTAPTVDVLDADHLVVRIPSSEGVVRCEFASLTRSRAALEAELTVSILSPNSEPEPFWQRVNILSQSAREALQRGLAAQFGKEIDPNWTTLISTAYARVRKVFEEVAPVEEMAGNLDIPPAQFLIRPYVLKGGGSILFGPPGKGKSNTAMLMTVSLDAGLENGLFDIVRPVRALYINLERPKESMEARLGRVNDVLGLEPARPLLFMNQRGRALADLMERIRQTIRRYDVGFVVLDSITRAAGGADLNDNRTGNQIIDLMNSLEVAWLGIGHTARADDTHLFGSQMFDAGADALISLASQETAHELGVSLAVEKANDFKRKQPALTLAYQFDDDGLINVRRARAGEFAEVENRAPKGLTDQIHAFLGEVGSASPSTIAKAIDTQRQTVSHLLRTRDDLFVMLQGSTGGRGKEATYALRAEGDPSGTVVPFGPRPPLDGDTCARCRQTRTPEGYGLGGRYMGKPLCADCWEIEGKNW